MVLMGIRRNSSSSSFSGFESVKHLNSDGVLQKSSLECGYYDVEKVQHVSRALILTLATACVEQSRGGLFSSPKSVSDNIRQELIQSIEEFNVRCLSNEDDPVTLIEGFLENFIKFRKSLFRRVSSKFLLSGDEVSKIDEAVAEFERSAVWSVGRRDYLARILLRTVDGSCRRAYCEERFETNEDLMQHKVKCRLRPVDCSSQGCDAVFSSARSAEHDAICLFKMVPCIQHCRATVMRGEMDMHCKSVCMMRPVNCPFSCVGCTRMIPQGEIQRHCEQETGSHLLSILHFLRKLDNSTESQCQRLVLLEKAVSIAQTFEGVDIGSLITTLREQDCRIKSLEQEVNKLRQEVKATDVSAEVLQLRREIRNLQRRIDGNNGAISPKSSGSPTFLNAAVANGHHSHQAPR